GCGTDGDCDDHVDCTLDSCNASHMCVHDLLDTRCADAGAGARCTAGGCSVLPTSCTSDTDCDDHLFCNGHEICMGEMGCFPATAAVDCGDTSMCTDDSCDPTMPTDGVAGSMGRCVHTCTMVPSGCPSCTPAMGHDGTYSLSPSTDWCSFATGPSSITSAHFDSSSGQLRVRINAVGMRSVTMTQTPAPSGDNFDVTVSVGGGCVENYELVGMFTDATHFTAML